MKAFRYILSRVLIELVLDSNFYQIIISSISFCIKTGTIISLVMFWRLNLYFFILMCQSWSRENKYSISLIWAYQLDMVVIMKLWFIIIIIQGATFINNNNMFFPVLFSQSPHSSFRMDFIFNILREKKKQNEKLFIKKLVVVVRKKKQKCFWTKMFIISVFTIYIH